jgi:Fe-S cluster biogenesis protein NfuA
MPPTTAKPAAPQSLRQKVQGVIDLIRPAVQADGGDIELVDVSEGGVVQIRFHGACHGCPSSNMTLQHAIDRNVREQVPEVTQVIPVK